ncbi:MAG TPA: hypothetical protein VHO04_18170 [Sphingopyxis sp.]|uniref:hypothetical protein n=1 Tax=Sphingopyxis sp. TaxID=1908224 RepID=UPI002E3029F3|nr:hypothetical protein [Sphingopyxis sp.]HEX2814608.1 hypothetical protein [Sphingopyxis sp.]
MAISDTLFDAIEGIRDDLASHPGAYGAVRPQIEALLAEMERVQFLLDAPPPTDRGGPAARSG